MNASALMQKYTNMPASSPWPQVAGIRFAANYMADFDGDGCDEVIVITPETQLPVPIPSQLGVLSYFNYSAIAPEWAAAGNQNQLISTSLSSKYINASFQYFPGKFRNTETMEMLLFDGNGIMQLLNWQNTALAVTDSVSQIPYSSDLSQSTWQLNQANSFYIGDIDGDGIDEILIKNKSATDTPVITMLGLVKWNAEWNDDNGRFEVIWTTDNGVISGVEGNEWTVYSNDQFSLGDIDKDSQAELIVFNSNDNLGVIKWVKVGNQYEFQLQGTSMQSIANGVPGMAPWAISENDWYKPGNLNGDGQLGLIAFNGYELGAIFWNGTNLELMGVSSGAVKGPNGNWNITKGEIHYVAPFESSNQDTIVVVDAIWDSIFPQLAIGLLRWDGAAGNFVADMVETPFKNFSGNPVTVLSSTSFTCADVDGDGITELVMQSNVDSSLNYLKWNGSTLNYEWNYVPDSISKTPLACWGIGLIANGPVTPFSSSFSTADQQSIYTQLSLSLSNNDTTDVRSLYADENNATVIASYAIVSDALSQLNQSPVQHYWSWMSQFLVSDLQCVLATILVEIQSVSNIWANDSNMDTFFTKMLGQQQTDLGVVTYNLVPVPADLSTDAGVYWTGQLLDAALWGIAAAAPEIGVPLSIVASLFGSLMGSVNSQNPPIALPYPELNAQLVTNSGIIQTAYDSMFYDNTGDTPSGINTDPVKLRVINKLITNWILNSGMTDQVVANSSNINRLGFYESLFNQVYSVWEWANYDPATGPEDVPDNATIQFGAGSDINFYVIAQSTSGNNWSGSGPYPSEDLTTDLFTTLSLSQLDFVNGKPPLNVSVYTGPLINNNNNPTIPPQMNMQKPIAR